MYARASTLQGSPEQIDEGVRTIQENIVPQMQNVPGYKGFITLADRTSGKSLTLTLWESEEAMRQSEQQADQLRGQAAEQMSSTIQSVERYEVLAFDVGS